MTLDKLTDRNYAYIFQSARFQPRESSLSRHWRVRTERNSPSVDDNINIIIYKMLLCFHSLLAYQPLWVIKCHSHWPCWSGLQNTPTASLQYEKPLNECTVYDIEKFDGEASVILELWGIQSTPSLLPLLGNFCQRGSTL